MPRKPRPSRLSIQSRLNQLQRENEELRDALETIADILEDVGILEPPEIEEDEPLESIEDPDEPNLIEADPSNLIVDEEEFKKP